MRKKKTIEDYKREVRNLKEHIKFMQQILQDNTPTFYGYGTDTTTHRGRGATVTFKGSNGNG